MACAYANWLTDCLALYASLMAVHATVPARSVILVYILAQLVAQVAVLPGGGGAVELALATGFAAFSGHHGTVFAGIMLYRFLACWVIIPVGWLAIILDPARAKSRTQTRTSPTAHAPLDRASPQTHNDSRRPPGVARGLKRLIRCATRCPAAQLREPHGGRFTPKPGAAHEWVKSS
jgi:hypothetical protein